MTTREALLAEAAEEYADRQRFGPRNGGTDAWGRVRVSGFKAGATWEAQRSAVLLEALEAIACPPDSNRRDFYGDIARAALEKYKRGKQ